MPMDYVQSYDFFWKRADWKLKFSFLPRKSALSNKILWLKKAYQGTATYTGPGDPVYETRWITKEEFMFERIKGKI